MTSMHSYSKEWINGKGATVTTSFNGIDVTCPACLDSIVLHSGRTIEIAGNGEYVMGVAHAATEHDCRLHS